MDRWLTVRADDCRTSDGAIIAPFYVLEYPDWVQVVAIDDEDNLILVEQFAMAWASHRSSSPPAA